MINLKLSKKILLLFGPLILGGIVGLIISSNIDYQQLIKPPLSPPSTIFPIVWTILYLLMGISYYLVNKNGNISNKTRKIYITQLIVNILWSIFFFIFKWRLFSILWIILLVSLIILMILEFKKCSKVASYIQIPYLIWTTFATYLTIGIYLLN